MFIIEPALYSIQLKILIPFLVSRSLRRTAKPPRNKQSLARAAASLALKARGPARSDAARHSDGVAAAAAAAAAGSCCRKDPNSRG
jgi:hypothetical protein